MQCLYINLDSAADRRAGVEGSFAAARKDGWSLERIAATDTDYVARAGVQGSIRPAEKACFLSHRNAVFHSLGHDGPVMIIEDDTVFSPKTCAVLDALMAAPPMPTWNILFADIGIGNISTMAELALLRNDFDATRRVKTIALAAVPFFGATAYVINGESKAKVLGLLDAVTSFDAAYDLYLRDLVLQGKLEAHAVFPFVTTSGQVMRGAGSPGQQPCTGNCAKSIRSPIRTTSWTGA